MNNENYCACGNLIISDKWHKNQKYCSSECRRIDWTNKNRDKIKKNFNKYLENNRELHNARCRDYYQRNKQRKLEWGRTEIERKKNNSRGTAKYYLRNVKECQSCGVTNNLHTHHIDFNPLNNDINNLIKLCTKCHGQKHQK